MHERGDARAQRHPVPDESSSEDQRQHRVAAGMLDEIYPRRVIADGAEVTPRQRRKRGAHQEPRNAVAAAPRQNRGNGKIEQQCKGRETTAILGREA